MMMLMMMKLCLSYYYYYYYDFLSYVFSLQLPVYIAEDVIVVEFPVKIDKNYYYYYCFERIEKNENIVSIL